MCFWLLLDINKNVIHSTYLLCNDIGKKHYLFTALFYFKKMNSERTKSQEVFSFFCTSKDSLMKVEKQNIKNNWRTPIKTLLSVPHFTSFFCNIISFIFEGRNWNKRLLFYFNLSLIELNAGKIKWKLRKLLIKLNGKLIKQLWTRSKQIECDIIRNTRVQ